MSKYLSLFDLAIGGVPVVVFCVWQLVSVNREIARDKRTDSPERSRHPVGEHRLDDR
jgi:hypothetical protein